MFYLLTVSCYVLACLAVFAIGFFCGVRSASVRVGSDLQKLNDICVRYRENSASARSTSSAGIVK